GRGARERLLAGDLQAVPVVVLRDAGGALRGAHLFEPLRRAETTEGVAVGEQLIRVLAVDRGALALARRSVRPADVRTLVPREPRPAQRFEDRAFRGERRAHLVGVLDAQQEIAAVLFGEAVVHQ